MRMKVRMDNQYYEVEIDDLRQRPIIAYIEGEAFEVWPETEVVQPAAAAAAPSASKPTGPAAPAKTAQPEPKPAGSNGSDALKLVRAPIPGVITVVNVRQGDTVAVGEQLCMLEAMKMNNSIRSSRAGKVAEVHVTVGQHVKHHDTLITFEA